MSDCTSEHKDFGEDSSEFLMVIPKKAYTKIDITEKLQIIQALDDGQCKADIAREYGMHLKTISHIYKQKDGIIKKYTQKYNLLKEVCSFNLDQNLLEWFEHEYTSANIITEKHLRDKAKDLLKELSEEFTCIDDWLVSFCTRHNISQYISEIARSEQTKEMEEWKRFLKNVSTHHVYLGGVCALSYNLDYNSFLNGQKADKYVSLFFLLNILGTEKKELVVVGSESLETESSLRSLPINYYCCDTTQINYSVILNFMTKWDNDLVSQGKSVTLILNVPDNIISKLHFHSIRLVSTTELSYVIIIIERIIECFKYHYRRLQIIRSTTYDKDSCTFLDYVHMMSMAWHCLPCKFVQSLSFCPENGSLYFNENYSDDCHSIAKWCKTHNLLLNLVGCSNIIDNFILCDKKLPCINCGQFNNSIQNATEVLSEMTHTHESGMDAYQAMKRLVNYLQGESAGGTVMNYAKYLENHLEYGALLQMHGILTDEKDSM